MPGGWAVCPACAAVVTDQTIHTQWHDDTTRAAAYAAGGGLDTTPGGPMWTGTGVPILTDTPTSAAVTTAAALREQAEQAMQAYAAGAPILDAWIEAPDLTPQGVTTQVITLTHAVRGLVHAAHDLIRLVARHALDSPGGGP